MNEEWFVKNKLSKKLQNYVTIPEFAWKGRKKTKKTEIAEFVTGQISKQILSELKPEHSC